MSVIEPDGRPITLDDLQALCRLLAGLDGHQREPADIAVWMTVAAAGRWTRAQVAAAALGIAATWTGFRIMPGHVTQQILADREQIRRAWHRPDPPRSLRDDPSAEVAWRQRAQADFAERALLALASGQLLDSVPVVLEPEPNSPPALPAAEQSRRIDDIVATISYQRAIPLEGSDLEDTGPGRRVRRVVLDDDVRREVRAELEARRDVAAEREAQRAAAAELAAYTTTVDR